MGNTYSEFRATGSTPRRAIENLMNKIGAENYRFSYDTGLRFHETTDGFYDTNIVVVDTFGVRKRAEINRLVNPTTGRVYYRAWFGLLEY